MNLARDTEVDSPTMAEVREYTVARKPQARYRSFDSEVSIHRTKRVQCGSERFPDGCLRIAGEVAGSARVFQVEPTRARGREVPSTAPVAVRAV